ncbi:MAG: EamA family transporter RarD [Oscillospiraceae bacterium]|nr:EamA family transporter RarD [Oscillospiraceae bacterium]
MLKKEPLLVLCCYILWGLLPIFWKTLASVDAFYILSVRIVFSLLFVALILIASGQFSAVRAALADRRERRLLFAAGWLVCANWGAYIWAVNNGHVLDASLAYYINPIMSILLGAFVFRERLSRLQWVSVALVTVGIIVTAVRFGTVPYLALLIAGSFALYGAAKKNVKSTSAVSLFVETLVTVPFAAVFLGWMESRGAGALGAMHGAQLLLLPLAGIVTAVPLLFYAAGIRKTPYAVAGILMFINPTLQFLLGVFLYGEPFTSTHALLFVFVWAGAALFAVGNLRGKKEKDLCE